MGTFIVNLIATSILLMFAFGLEDVTNETLSENDFDQLIAIISSIILVSILCICFLQWVIGVEIKALFISRKEFNINMRLMGVGSKDIGNIYFKELFQMQIIAVPVGFILTFVIYYLISLRTLLPWIGLNVIAAAIIIHLACILVSIKMVLRKLIGFDIAIMMRGQGIQRGDGIKSWSWWSACAGLLLILAALFLDMLTSVEDIELIYMLGILLSGNVLFYVLGKWIIIIADTMGISTVSFSERIQIGNYKKNKNTVMMLAIGIMLFFGLQIVFTSARYTTNIVGQSNLNYQNHISFENLTAEEDVIQAVNGKHGAIGLNYVFYIEESSYPKYLNGIDKTYLDMENIIIDESLSGIDLEEKLDNPDWNGILLPNVNIGKDNIGKEMVLTIEGREITFIIKGGYYQNTFDKNIWLASKSYIQKQLGHEGVCNTLYLADNDKRTLTKLKEIGSFDIQNKQTIILNSVNKVVQSTEIVEISSMIVIICSMVSIVSYLILGANENIRDIAKFRTAGLKGSRIRLIYMMQLCGCIFKGLIMGLILAVLFARVSLRAVLSGMNIRIVLQIPYGMLAVLFVVLSILILSTYYMSTRRGFGEDFTLILRNNDNG